MCVGGGGCVCACTDPFQETFKKFERNYADLVTAFVENVQAKYPIIMISFYIKFVVAKIFRLSV